MIEEACDKLVALEERRQHITYTTLGNSDRTSSDIQNRVVAWAKLIDYMLSRGVKLSDCKERFSRFLAMWCLDAGLSMEKCKEIQKQLLTETKRVHEYQIEYIYKNPDKAKYLPHPISLINKDEWYVCKEDQVLVETIRKLFVTH